MSARWLPSIEAIFVLAVTLPAALLTRQPSLWFLVPFLLLTLLRRDYDDYGLNLDAWRQWGNLRFHLLNIGGVFLPYVVGHCLLARFWFGQHFSFGWPDQLPWLLIDQLLGVALPEEFFFRGYLQSRLNRSFGRPFEVLGARCGLGLVVAAALFAACHVPLGGPAQLIVFFPGLWYGWLRERTDSVVVPTVYHAVSNVLLRVMLSSLR